MTAAHWIRELALQPHPEGDWFREHYRAAESIARAALPERFTGDRAFSTAIYFLLQSDECSKLHRIRQDEVWHFYDGNPLTVHVVGDEYTTLRVSRERPVAVVEAGALFGATVDDGYALVGCTVAPGFDFDDFEMPDRATLLEQYPRHRAIIERLTTTSAGGRSRS